MRRYVIGVLMVFALAIASTGASAQLIPTGYSQGFGPLRAAEVGAPSLYGGWVSDGKTFNYETTRPVAGIFNVSIAEYNYNYSSFLMGATLPISLGDYGVVSLSGSWSLPSTYVGHEALKRPNLKIRGKRRWNADTSWGTAEAVWAYPLTGSCSTLIGFRWDNWQTSYQSPIIEVTSGPGFLSPTDAGDFTVNSYIPLVGLMTTYGGLNLGAMGFPALSGQAVQHMSFNDRYFKRQSRLRPRVLP